MKPAQRPHGFPLSLFSPRCVMVRSAIVTISLVFLWWGLVFGQSSQEAQLHADNGLKLMRHGDLPAAVAELRQAVKLSPRDPTHLGELGVALGIEQKFAESDLYFQRALRFDPGNAPVRRNLAKNQWRLGEFENAEANLKEVLKAHPGDGESTLILGMVEEALKHFAAAVRLLDSIPSLTKQHPESMDALAQSYYQLKNQPAARQTLRGLLQVNAPPEAQHYQQYASFQVERAEGGDARAEARAYDALHRAISLDNSLARSHLLLGRLELKNNRVEQAVSELETAAKLDPKDGLTHLLLSRAYTRLDKPDEAAKEAAIYKSSAQAEVRSGRLRTRSTLRRW